MRVINWQRFFDTGVSFYFVLLIFISQYELMLYFYHNCDYRLIIIYLILKVVAFDVCGYQWFLLYDNCCMV